MTKTILIAEDDKGVLKQLTRAVEEAGYRCIQAMDGLKALELVSDDPPDLILLDLLLPKKDGRGVLATLQGRDRTRDIPVIAMSGVFRGRKTSRELRDAGAQGFLEKPFSPEDLVAHLHALVGPPEQETPEPPVNAKANQAGAKGKAKGEASGATPDSVSLASSTVAEVLWRAMNEGFSGALQFQEGEQHKVVVLRDGIPCQVRSNRAAECLGRRLFHAGAIDGDTLRESLRRARDKGGLQGEILVGMGAVTQDQVDHELRAQAEDKLLELFSWDDGDAWRQEGVSEISFATELEDWTPRLVVLRGVNRMTQARALRQLGELRDRELVLCDGDLSGEELLIPHVAEAMAHLRSDTSTAEVIDAHAPAVYGLWLTGVARPVDQGSERVESAPAATGCGSSNPEAEELRRVLAEMQDKDYFELLELDRTADAKEARSMFTKFAKKYHPDRHSTKPEPVRAAVSDIFALLSSACDTITGEKERREYLRKLEGTNPDQERKAVEAILSAEQTFTRGEAAFRRRAYTEALELFETAAREQPGEADYQAYYGWTRYLVHHREDGAAELALERIEKAISLAPKSVTGYYFRGRLHKACDEPEPAQKMFRKVLEIDPEHVDASRELRLLEMRKSKDSKPGPGLFGRKKG